MQNQSIDEFILKDDIQELGYTWGGGESPVDSPECLAKVVENLSKETTQYFVKMFRGDAGLIGFVNPTDPNYHPSMLTKFNNHIGRKSCEFTKVTKEAFDIYRIFLRTKNSTFCRQAERCA